MHVHKETQNSCSKFVKSYKWIGFCDNEETNFKL